MPRSITLSKKLFEINSDNSGFRSVIFSLLAKYPLFAFSKSINFAHFSSRLNRSLVCFKTILLFFSSRNFSSSSIILFLSLLQKEFDVKRLKAFEAYKAIINVNTFDVNTLTKSGRSIVVATNMIVHSNKMKAMTFIISIRLLILL